MPKLENIKINGRPATVIYLDDKFVPVALGKAEMVKAIFTDEEGGSLFLVRDHGKRLQG